MRAKEQMADACVSWNAKIYPIPEKLFGFVFWEAADNIFPVLANTLGPFPSKHTYS